MTVVPFSETQVILPPRVLARASRLASPWWPGSARGRNPTPPVKFATGLGLLGIGYIVMYFASRYVVGVTLPVAGGGDLALNYGQMEALRDQHLGPQQLSGL